MEIAGNENDSIIINKRDIHLRIKHEQGKLFHSARTQLWEISPMI